MAVVLRGNKRGDDIVYKCLFAMVFEWYVMRSLTWVHVVCSGMVSISILIRASCGDAGMLHLVAGCVGEQASGGELSCDSVVAARASEGGNPMIIGHRHV